MKAKPLIFVLLIVVIIGGCTRFLPKSVAAGPATLEPSDTPSSSTPTLKPSHAITVTPARDVIEPSNAGGLRVTTERQFIGSTGFTWVTSPEENTGEMALSQEEQVKLLTLDSTADADVVPDDYPSMLISSSGSRRIAWKNANEAVRIWDLGEAKELLMIQGDQSAITSLALSSAGDMLAVSTSDNKLRIWDISQTETTLDIQVNSWLSGLEYSPDNQLLAGVDPQNFSVKILDVSTGEEIREYYWTETASPVLYGADLSSDWGQIAWYARGSVQIMDAGTGALGRTLSHEDFVNAIAWSPDGRLLASAAAGTVNGNFSPLVYLWNTKTGNITHTLVFREPVSDVEFSPDGRDLAVLLSDGTLQIWTVE